MLKSGRYVLRSQKTGVIGVVWSENPELPVNFHKKYGFFWAFTLYYGTIGFGGGSSTGKDDLGRLAEMVGSVVLLDSSRENVRVTLVPRRRR
ncbi:MAG: hypothetical protein ACE5E5_07680 [Phycisphaerae bacterium]